MSRLSRLLLIALLASTSPLGAQDVTAPKAVASEFLAAAGAGRWETVLRLTERESMRQYVAEQRKRHVAMATYRHEPMTVESYMRSDTTMPRAVAEYFVSRNAKYPTPAPPAISMFVADVERASQLDSLSDGELYVRLLRARQFDYFMTTASKLTICGMKVTGARMPKVERTLRGVALISESEAIALYAEVNGMPAMPDQDALRQLQLRRTADGWRVVASGSTLGTMGGSFAVGCDDSADPG